MFRLPADLIMKTTFLESQDERIVRLPSGKWSLKSRLTEWQKRLEDIDTKLSQFAQLEKHRDITSKNIESLRIELKELKNKSNDMQNKISYEKKMQDDILASLNNMERSCEKLQVTLNEIDNWSKHNWLLMSIRYGILSSLFLAAVLFWLVVVWNNFNLFLVIVFILSAYVIPVSLLVTYIILTGSIKRRRILLFTEQEKLESEKIHLVTRIQKYAEKINALNQDLDILERLCKEKEKVIVSQEQEFERIVSYLTEGKVENLIEERNLLRSRLGII